MRYVSKFFVITVGLLAFCLVSSSASANEALAGKFKLNQRTQWNNTVLPAGDYTFTLTRSQSHNLNLLTVRGTKQKIDMFIRAERECETCQNGTLNLTVQGDQVAVTSMNLAGIHANFKFRQLSGATVEESAKTPKSSEQVAVHVDPN